MRGYSCTSSSPAQQPRQLTSPRPRPTPRTLSPAPTPRVSCRHSWRGGGLGLQPLRAARHLDLVLLEALLPVSHFYFFLSLIFLNVSLFFLHLQVTVCSLFLLLMLSVLTFNLFVSLSLSLSHFICTPLSLSALFSPPLAGTPSYTHQDSNLFVTIEREGLHQFLFFYIF